MENTTILQPVFVQVVLTFFLMLWMAKERLGAIRDGTVQRGQPGTRPVWVGRAGYVSNAYHNQLEAPMLFYAVVAFAMMTNAIDWKLTALAWAYVGFRVLQASIHTTYNNILHRFLAFLAGNVVLMIMWLLLAMHVLFRT